MRMRSISRSTRPPAAALSVTTTTTTTMLFTLLLSLLLESALLATVTFAGGVAELATASTDTALSTSSDRNHHHRRGTTGTHITSSTSSHKPASSSLSSSMIREGSITKKARLQGRSFLSSQDKDRALTEEDFLLPHVDDSDKKEPKSSSSGSGSSNVNEQRDLQIIQASGCTRKKKSKKSSDEDDDDDDDDDGDVFDCTTGGTPTTVQGRVTLSPATSQVVVPQPTTQLQPGVVVSPPTVPPQPAVIVAPSSPSMPTARPVVPVSLPTPRPTAFPTPSPITVAATPRPTSETQGQPTPPVVEETVAVPPTSSPTLKPTSGVSDAVRTEACQAARYGNVYETPRNVTIYYQYELLTRIDADLPGVVWPTVDGKIAVSLARSLVDCTDIDPSTTSSSSSSSSFQNDNIFSPTTPLMSSSSSSSSSIAPQSPEMNDWVLGVSPEPRDSFGTWFPSDEIDGTAVECTGVGEYDENEFFCDVVTGSVTVFVKDGFPLSGASGGDDGSVTDEETGSSVSNLVDLRNWVFSILQDQVNNYDTNDGDGVVAASRGRGGDRKLRYRGASNGVHSQSTPSRKLNPDSPFYDPDNGIYDIFFLSEPVEVALPPPIDGSGSGNTDSAESTTDNQGPSDSLNSSVEKGVIASLVGVTLLAMILAGFAIQRRKARQLAEEDSTQIKYIPDIDDPFELSSPQSTGPRGSHHEASSLNSSGIAYSESDSYGYSLPDTESGYIQKLPGGVVINRDPPDDKKPEAATTYNIATIRSLAEDEMQSDDLSLNNDPSEGPRIRNFGLGSPPSPISKMKIDRDVIHLREDESDVRHSRWSASVDQSEEDYSSYCSDDILPPPASSMLQESEDISREGDDDDDDDEVSELPSERRSQNPSPRMLRISNAGLSRSTTTTSYASSSSKSSLYESRGNQDSATSSVSTPPSKTVTKSASPDSVVEPSWSFWVSPTGVPTPRIATDEESPELATAISAEANDETIDSTQSRTESLKIRRRQLEDRFQMYKKRLSDSTNVINESTSSSDSWMSAREVSRRQSVSRNDYSTTCQSLGIGSRSCLGTPSSRSTRDQTLHDSYGFTPSSSSCLPTTNNVTSGTSTQSSSEKDRSTLGIMPRVAGNPMKYKSLNDIENMLDRDQEWKSDDGNDQYCEHGYGEQQQQERGQHETGQPGRQGKNRSNMSAMTSSSALPSKEVVNSVIADEENMNEFLHERIHAVAEPETYAQFTSDTVQL